MDYPIALVMAIAADREDDLLEQLSSVLSIEEPGLLKVILPNKFFRFMYKRVVSGTGVDTVTLPAYPSSGTGEKWHLWIIQPYDILTPSEVKTFRDKLANWAAARQPTGGGLWHLLGPYTPEKFRTLVSAAIWTETKNSWWTIWRAESSVVGVAAQQACDDPDLDFEE